MRVWMGGIDHSTADVDVRGRFSVAGDAARAALRHIRRQPGVAGCVLLSTCNRAELYVCGGTDAQDVPALLCGALGLDAGQYRGQFTCRADEEAVLHLCGVAAGTHSRVLGEDQILAQVKDAAALAREAGVAGPVMETLFRAAVTAGKRVKTQVQFFKAGGSVARRAVQRLEEACPPEAAGRVLVIGNGETGRLAAAELLVRGYDVGITLRQYRHGRADVPAGCAEVAYEARYGAMAECGAVVSATSSPHFTVKAEQLSQLARVPGFFIDLAVPRDIEPAVASLANVALWTVDDFGADEAACNREGLLAAGRIIGEEAGRFFAWQAAREAPPLRGTQARRGGMPHNGGQGELPGKSTPQAQAGPSPKRTPGRGRSAEGARFPVFIDLAGRLAVVVGGGKIAARRAGVLLRFGANVRVVSPALCPQLAALAEAGGVEWRRGAYAPGDLAGAALAVAATDDRAVNRRVGRDANGAGILVSVADSPAECAFFFPAVVQSEHLTAGIVSNHGDHALVRQTAAILRERLEEIEQDDTDWQQAEPSCGGAVSTGDERACAAVPGALVRAGDHDDHRG